jgi:amidase
VGAPLTTFITRYDTVGNGTRLAVKDLIDMEGEPTTAGCRAVANGALPARRDAACMAGARAAGARIVGRTNLHELALGVTGINPWYGTPVNPVDPGRVPGGSSSGSAVAVATGEADVAYGTDTGGSIRIPSACCGTSGLKTTWGRIPSIGVWPLAPSFDSVGPMARDVAGLVRGMELLEPGFVVAETTGVAIGRLRPPADPLIDAAVDRALFDAEWPVL